MRALVAEHAFFAGLGEKALDLVAGCGRNAAFAAGETLAREGTEADSFFAVREGRVAIEIHAPGRGSLAVQTVGPGGVVGWSWLFPPHRWIFDARAVEPVRAIRFDGRCLRKKCDADHELGYEFMKRFSAVFVKRLEATRLQLLDVYGGATHARGR
jgi:CRP-like cAMP-binding protein